MSRYHLRPLLAVTDDGRMPFGRLDEPTLTDLPLNQQIIAAHAWTEPLVVDADTASSALETLFREANIGEDGWARRYRDGRQRSLSVGDLVEVRNETTGVCAYYQCLSAGFAPLDEHVGRVRVDEPWSIERVEQQREQYETEGGR